MSEPRRHGSRDTVAHFGQKGSEGSTFSSTVFFFKLRYVLGPVNGKDTE